MRTHLLTQLALRRFLGRTRRAKSRSNAQLSQRNHCCSLPTLLSARAARNEECFGHRHIARRLARVHEYTAEFERRRVGEYVGAAVLFNVMEGAVTLEAQGKRHELGHALRVLPRGFAHGVSAKKKAELPLWKSTIWALRIRAPRLIVSSEDAVSSHALNGDYHSAGQCLLPDDASFDLRSHHGYQPGASLSMVEMHVMDMD